jgi:cytochrome P450
MLDFPITPVISVRDSPVRRLATVNEARAYVDELLAQRRFSKWREMLDRLDGIKTEEDAVEAIGALRELLAMEHLLAA